MFNSLQPHEPQHAQPLCPSPTPRVYTNPCPSSQWCHPAISSSLVPFSSCPQSLPAWVLSNESVLCIRWPKYWSFSFNSSPSNEHPGLISFRMDWFDLLAVQGTLKSLLQHHSSKASILWHSTFFTVQLSHPYMTTGKTITLTRRTFVGKVIGASVSETHSGLMQWKSWYLIAFIRGSILGQKLAFLFLKLDAWGWCTGTTQRDSMGREGGGGFRMGNTCTPMADSCVCMAKTTTIL